MDEEFIQNVEMIIFKMIEEGKIVLQKTVNNKGEIFISLNCILKNDEPEDNGEYLMYVANPEGRFGVKIDDIGNI